MMFLSFIIAIACLLGVCSAATPVPQSFVSYYADHNGAKCDPKFIRALNIIKVSSACQADNNGKSSYALSCKLDPKGNYYGYSSFSDSGCQNMYYSGPASDYPKCTARNETSDGHPVKYSTTGAQCASDLNSVLQSVQIAQPLVYTGYDNADCKPGNELSWSYMSSVIPPDPHSPVHSAYQCHNHQLSIAMFSDKEPYPIGVSQDSSLNACRNDNSNHYNKLGCDFESPNFLDIHDIKFPKDNQASILPLPDRKYLMIDVYTSDECDPKMLYGTLSPMVDACVADGGGTEKFGEVAGKILHWSGNGNSCDKTTFPSNADMEIPYGQCFTLDGFTWLKARPSAFGAAAFDTEMHNPPTVGKYYEVKATTFDGLSAIKVWYGVIGPNGPVNTTCHEDNDSPSYEFQRCQQGRLVVYSHKDSKCQDLQTVLAYEYTDPSKQIITFCTPGPFANKIPPSASPTSKPFFKPTKKPVPKPTTKPTLKPVGKPSNYPTWKPLKSLPTNKPTKKTHKSRAPVVPEVTHHTHGSGGFPDARVTTRIRTGYTLTTIKVYSDNTCVQGTVDGKEVMICDL